jgi:hypothetical protein
MTSSSQEVLMPITQSKIIHSTARRHFNATLHDLRVNLWKSARAGHWIPIHSRARYCHDPLDFQIYFILTRSKWVRYSEVLPMFHRMHRNVFAQCWNALSNAAHKTSPQPTVVIQFIFIARSRLHAKQLCSLLISFSFFRRCGPVCARASQRNRKQNFLFTSSSSSSNNVRWLESVVVVVVAGVHVSFRIYALSAPKRTLSCGERSLLRN